MKAMKSSRKLLLVLCLFLSGLVSYSQGMAPSQKEKWEFVLAPYMFMAGTSGDAILGVTGPSEFEIGRAHV